MTQSLVSIGFFLVLLACLPLAIKWVKQRSGLGVETENSQSKLISALAVGPHQRVVTVEVGPEGARQRLTLGVTPQSITCLHTAPVDVAALRVEGTP
jgi:flagellar protein FliO/FliZ